MCGGHGVRLGARLCQRRHAPATWSVIPLLVVAFTALLAVPPVAGTGVQHVAGIGAFNGVACPPNSQCVGVGTIFTTASAGAVGAAAPLTAASGTVSRGQSVQTIRGTELLSAVSCPSRTQCLAVGENSDASEGVAVPLDPETGAVRAGQSVQSIPGIFMAAVACPSTTLCLGVGHAPEGQGVVVSLDPTTGAIAMGEGVVTIPGTGGVGLEGVACPTTTQCLAVGENASASAGAAVPLDPATGAPSKGQGAQSVTTKGVLVGVSCPSAAVCLAVGWGADQPSVAVPLDPATGMVSSGRRDQTISSRAAKLSAVACPSVSQCLAVGNDAGDPSHGQAVPLSPVTGVVSSGQSIQGLAGTGALNAVACLSAARCVVSGSGFEASGGASLVLSPATASPTTGPATPPKATVTRAGASSLGQTGGNLLPLLIGGGALVAGGAAFVVVRSRPRSERTAAADGEYRAPPAA